MTKSLVVIKSDKADEKPIVEPIESLWKEMRHSRATLIYLKSLVDDAKPNKGYLSHWLKEIAELQNSLQFIEKKFGEIYIGSLCVLREFEISKYDRAYLEIAFTKHL